MRMIIDVFVLDKTELRLNTKNVGSFLIETAEMGKLRCLGEHLYPKIEVGNRYNLRYQTRTKAVLGLEGDDAKVQERERPEPDIPINEAEAQLYHKMIDGGWDVTRRGFPDFACFKDDRLILVEVKPKRNHRLKTRQKQVMEKLSSLGIECYRWSPDVGFERIMVSQPQV